MLIASPGTLLLAAALASPTLMDAISGDTGVDDAALRFLICVPVAAIMLAVLFHPPSKAVPEESKGGNAPH